MSYMPSVSADYSVGGVDLEGEATARADADSVLAASIVTEASARADADSVLAASIVTEANARSDTDSVLSASIVTETSGRLAEVAGERTRVDDIIAMIGAADGVAELDGAGKLPISRLPISTVIYCGTWNAATNTPTITSGQSSIDAGCYRIVSSPGTTVVDGVGEWAVRDWIIWSGVQWSKVDNTESVTAVNGRQGAVTLGLEALDDVTINSAGPGEF